MSPIALKSVSISKFIGYLSFVLLCLAFLAYATYQARFILLGPQVTLTEMPVNHSSQKILIEGRAKNITEISLNDRNILTDETGYFKEPLILENGYTIVRISAVDRYGRETATERSFVYVPQSLLPTS